MKTTIKDIAKMAKVSTATVSRVINNNPEGVGQELRNNILKIVRETGYKPNLLARSMITNKTHTIGLLSPDIVTPFYQYVIKGINDCLQAAGYTMLLCNVESGAAYREQVETMLAKGTDGIILMGFFGETSQTLAEILTGVPVVLFDYVPRLEQIAQINTNNRASARELTSHLIENGHRRIGCIMGPEQFDTVRERLKGYQKALEDAGIPYNPKIMLNGDFSTDSALEPAARLITETDVSAIFCFNDLMAYGVYKYCAQCGKRIPEDISVAGFDDIPYSELLNPPLTTVRQPGYRLGAESAKMLLEQINGTAEPRMKRILSNTLMIRGSVKNINNRGSVNG
ncbi:MAG: LacI family transcriptional regulator [Spirochaetaceae bacterium]|jgi:LacI family transcriptional regulator|nr:LacI family transcriptional regulator [Spirochaetaceae bacterium]GMO24131.1 MAG: HTH-type transcriptional repressor PurR [Termitinemataceae bacterium]